MDQIAGCIAPLATAVAAVMTASNLGARVTGWGFAVFVIGSLAWCAVGLASGQPNLLWANGFLTVVNLVGVWRWLGRQARYEKGGDAARARSAHGADRSLAPLNRLIGATVSDRQGAALGAVVEIMVGPDLSVAYVVVSSGGVGGIGERLHALDRAEVECVEDGVRTTVSREDIERRPTLDADTWPA